MIPPLLQITFSHRDARPWSGVQHSPELSKAQTKADYVPEEMVAIYNCLIIHTYFYMRSSCETKNNIWEIVIAASGTEQYSRDTSNDDH